MSRHLCRCTRHPARNSDLPWQGSGRTLSDEPDLKRKESANFDGFVWSDPGIHVEQTCKTAAGQSGCSTNSAGGKGWKGAVVCAPVSFDR